jgi:hypothetical protein
VRSLERPLLNTLPFLDQAQDQAPEKEQD